MNQKLLLTFVMLGVCGCAAETSDAGDGAPEAPAPEKVAGTTTEALLPRVPLWKGGVRKLGGQCKFEDDAKGPADAFVIANGQDVSIVFTRLGEATRLGPDGVRLWSRCKFALPIDVPQGLYVSGWHQSLEYGVVKPAGVGAGLGLESQLQGDGVVVPLPAIDLRFPKPAELDVALDTAVGGDLTIDPTRPRHAKWKRISCNPHRSNDLVFVGGAYTWTQHTARRLPVIIAIDGLDARFDLGAILGTCP